MVGFWWYFQQPKLNHSVFVFLPSLGYQKARGYSKKCWNTKEACLPIHISHNHFFSVLQKHKVDWGLLILECSVQSISGLTNWHFPMVMQLEQFVSSYCQGCFCILSQCALKIRITYVVPYVQTPPRLLWESDIDSVINKVSSVTFLFLINLGTKKESWKIFP